MQVDNINNKTFWNLILDYRIRIPKYQRDYVQGNYGRVCKKLLCDIKDSFINSKKLDLGFIYGSIKNDYFEPVDGQQRLTTLFLLYAYIFVVTKDIDKLKKLVERFDYQTRLTSSRFIKYLDRLKDYSDGSIEDFIKNADWYQVSFDDDPTISAAINTLNYINEIFSDVNQKELKAYLIDCDTIGFQFLIIDNIGNSGDLYIKMNSRGKQLTHFESFKSNFYEYANELVDDQFKDLLENKAYEVVWNNVSENPMDNTDISYMQILHNIFLLNALTNINIKAECTIIIDDFKNNETNNYFDDYKQYINKNNTIQFLQSFLRMFFELNNLNENFIVEQIIKSKSYPELVKLFAIIKYGIYININNKNFNHIYFRDYYRVICNLIDNTNVDTKESFYDAIKSINCIDEKLMDNVNLQLSNIDVAERYLTFFSEDQEKEEIIKAYAIIHYENLKEYIEKIEELDYFKSEILWALKLEGYDYNNYKKYNDKPINQIKKVLMLFDKNGLRFNDSIFKRALLTFGDYSMQAGNSKTIFFEGKEQYFNLRRLLREENSFVIFKKFYDSIDTDNIENYMSMLIDSFVDVTDEFKYYIIRDERLLENSRQNRFIKNNDGRIIILHGSRLNGYYDEFHIYILKLLLDGERISNEYHCGIGYLDSSTSKCDISSINGKDVELFYNNNCYTYNGKTYNSSTVKEMYKIIKEDYL